MIEGMSVLNYTVYCSGAVLCLLGIAMIAIFGETIGKLSRNCFIVFFATLFVDLIINIVTQMFIGSTDAQSGSLMYFLHFLHQLLSPSLAYIVCYYQVLCLQEKRKQKAYLFVIAAMLAVFLIALTVNGLTKGYFYVDADGFIRRNDGYVLSFIISFLPIILSVYILIRERRQLTVGERRAFWLYNTIPAAAVIAQLFFTNTHLIIPATIIAALIMFIFIISEQTKAYYAQEQRQSELNVAVMLSQIQPHFLYNALDSIYYLCEQNPKRAQEAMADFSRYLRVNLNAIKQREPIPFETERKHTETYLALEKMSMEEKLEYEFDCQAEDFLIPVLTLQPLVENAVKHGVSKRTDGGKVVISTRRQDGTVVITIEDNGVGFDSSVFNDGEPHIGIGNVRERLSAQCKGSLDIQSTPGKGTTAVIRIKE